MYRRFLAFLTKHKIEKYQTTLLAVSGGVDSVVLAHLFVRSGYPFAIAHANFGLRPGAADQDAEFVSKLAQTYRVPLHGKRFTTLSYARQHQLSVQMAARRLRYAWFEALCTAHNYSYTATGHHHNDQLESFIRHFTKGTGIAGLQGIKAKQGALIRPLLFATKEEILDYAQAEKLTWREDSSNQQLKYERNYIRHQVIPQLKQINPSLATTFTYTLARQQQLGLLFEAESKALKAEAWQTLPPYHYIQLAPLAKKPWAPIILASWLTPFGFSFRLLQQWWERPPQPGCQYHTKRHWLLIDRSCWVVGPNSSPLTSTLLIDALPFISSLPGYQVSAQLSLPEAVDIYAFDPYSACFDYSKLSFPLLLRPWQQGDRLSPLGMKGKSKKVSDLLIDLKVPRHKKGQVYVLVSQEKLVWVVGHRLDERFKVSPTTNQICQITCQPVTPLLMQDEG